MLKNWCELSVEKRRSIRREEARQIDPNTAVLCWNYVNVYDPYDEVELPEECYCLGDAFFARRPDSDIWVLLSYPDFPHVTAYFLWQRVVAEFDGSNWSSDATKCG